MEKGSISSCSEMSGKWHLKQIILFNIILPQSKHFSLVTSWTLSWQSWHLNVVLNCFICEGGIFGKQVRWKWRLHSLQAKGSCQDLILVWQILQFEFLIVWGIIMRRSMLSRVYIFVELLSKLGFVGVVLLKKELQRPWWCGPAATPHKAWQ